MPSENTDCIAAAFRWTYLVLGKVPRVVYQDNGRAFSSMPVNTAAKVHIASKPFALLQELMGIVVEGGIILDPFLGEEQRLMRSCQ